MRSKDLRAERAQLIDQARAKNDAGDGAECDRLLDLAKEFDDKIKRCDRLEAREAELSAMQDTRAQKRGVSVDQVANEDDEQLRLFNTWARHGLEAFHGEDRQRVMANLSPIAGLKNAQGVGTGSAGGFTIPPAYQAEILVAIKAQGGVREAARGLDTTAGQDLPWPTLDDTANIGELLPENTQISAQDVAFGTQTLKSYTYSSKLVLVSWQLLNDTTFDIPGLLRDAFAGRLARITNLHFSTGTGTGQPQGVVTAAPIGKTGATGQTTSVTFDDLIDLEMSIDPAYRAGARWMFNDNTLKVLRKLKDTTGRYLWQRGDYNGGVTGGVPDLILNRPYTVNQDMPNMAANAKSILCGDFRNYIVRSVKEMQVVRMNEKYADFLQTGFFAYGRFDGRLVSAASPIKAYANSAT